MSDDNGSKAGKAKLSFSLGGVTTASRKKALAAAKDKKRRASERDSIAAIAGSTLTLADDDDGGGGAERKPKRARLGGGRADEEDEATEAPLVIPLASATWHGGEASAADGATATEPPATAATSDSTPAANEDEAAAARILAEVAGEVSDDGDERVPLIIKNKIPGVVEGKSDGAKLDADLAVRPEVDDGAYDRVPIEAFGAAMLRGMGWSDGGAIGRSNASVVAPVEYVPRMGRRGLGAKAGEVKATHGKRGRPIRQGESRVKQELVAAGGGNTVAAGEELVAAERVGLFDGQYVVVLSGTHKGLSGQILAMESGGEGSQRASVRLDASSEVVDISRKHLQSLPEYLEERRIQREQEKAEAFLADAADGKAKAKGKAKKKAKSKDKAKARSADWLRTGIRVRIVSKSSFKGGRYYNKKGLVMDVPARGSCLVRLDDGGKLLHDVPASALETLVPKKAGGHVIVLRGDHRGETGVLMDRNKAKSTATIQLDDTLDVAVFGFDDLATYVEEA